MPRWAVVFTDRSQAEAGHVRAAHSQDHFDYLARNPEIQIAGGLRPAPDAWYCGGLWVVDAETRAEVVRLVEADPYHRLGLRSGYQIYVWGKAPCYGKVEL